MKFNPVLYFSFSPYLGEQVHEGESLSRSPADKYLETGESQVLTWRIGTTGLVKRTFTADTPLSRLLRTIVVSSR